MKIKQGQFNASPNHGGMKYYTRERLPVVEYTTAWERCTASVSVKEGWRQWRRGYRYGSSKCVTSALHTFVVQVDQPEWQLLLWRLDTPGLALAGRTLSRTVDESGLVERSVEMLVATSGIGRTIKVQSVFGTVYERGDGSYTGAAGKTLASAQRKARRLLLEWVVAALPVA